MATKEAELDEILSNLGVSNVPNTNGQYHEVDPTSIVYVKAALLNIIDSEVKKARKEEREKWQNKMIAYDANNFKFNALSDKGEQK